tara:strand:+ start:857 stop:2140 length:1284 start_codon:yes stop_codon:yes gene_type:complete
MGCTCKKPKIQKVEADSFELPQTGYQFVDPFAEDISRRILSSYFGSPGEYEGLIAQERDIPIEGTADLTDLEREARTLSGNLGQFGEYIPEAVGVAREGIDAARFGVDQLGQGTFNLAEAARLARDPSEAIETFSDPFEQQVVQQAIRDITEQSEQQGIANRAGAVDAGAFGGSRGRLQETERQEALGRGLLEAVGGIRSQGFQGARDAAAQQVSQLGSLGQGMGTAGLAYSTLGQGISGLGSQLGSIGAAGQDLLTGRIGTLENLGQAQRGITQDALSRRFRAADVLADEPFTRLQRGQALLAGLPMGGISGGTGAQMYQPQTYSMPSSLQRGIGTLGQLGTALGQFKPSDKRLKTNIKKLGSVNDINIYSWTWNKLAKLMGVHLNNPITTGVMAQEVMHIPGVVNLNNDGFYSVNYKILDNLIIK